MGNVAGTGSLHCTYFRIGVVIKVGGIFICVVIEQGGLIFLKKLFN